MFCVAVLRRRARRKTEQWKKQLKINFKKSDSIHIQHHGNNEIYSNIVWFLLCVCVVYELKICLWFACFDIESKFWKIILFMRFIFEIFFRGLFIHRMHMKVSSAWHSCHSIYILIQNLFLFDWTWKKK